MQVKEVRGHVGVLKNNRRHGLNASLNCLTLTHQTVIRVGFLHRTTFEFYNSLLFCAKISNFCAHQLVVSLAGF